MLDSVGLIHMRGRVYDPVIGRFLSVDPLVRDVTATQSWNGYGYVEGRALSATDPSGYALSFDLTGPIENVIATERREPCDRYGLLCNVNVGQEIRFYLQTWGFIPQSGRPGGFTGSGAAGSAPLKEKDVDPCASDGTITDFLQQHGSEVVFRTLDIMGGAGQTLLGAGVCSGGPSCVGGVLLAAHGASNIYEGVTGSGSILRDGYHAVLGSAGDLAYSAVNIGSSVYGLTRSVLRPGTWSLFRNISSDYVPAFRTMTRGELLVEGAGLMSDAAETGGLVEPKCDEQP